MHDETKPPLHDIRVVDLTNDRGEMAGRLLADLGATVIKVEPPDGTASRHLPPWEAGHRGDTEGSLFWAAYGLGKKSAVVDYASDAGRNQVLELAGTADVLLESFEPGEAGRLGFGYEQVRVLNPQLIYTSISPYGQTGPDAHSPATNLTIEAAGGLVNLQGDPDRPPIPSGYPQAFLHAGAQAAADTVIALNERAQSGLGQHLDSSAQAAMVWTLMHATGFPSNTGGNPPGTSENRAMASDATPGVKQVIPGVNLPDQWQGKEGWLVGIFGVSALGGRTADQIASWMAEEGFLDDRLKGINFTDQMMAAMDGRHDTAVLQLLVDQMVAFFATRTKAEILERALRGVLFVPALDISDLFKDEQLAARNFWTKIDGRTHPSAFAVLPGTPIAPRRAAPRLGEHQAILEASHVPAAPPQAHQRAHSRAFDGIKVADFSWVGVGPLISKALADHGATVVRVESSTRPDGLRTQPPFKDNEADLDRAQFFANFNSSKLGLATNLATPAGRTVARKLIDWADVVVESFTPGTLDRMGLGYEAVREGRPDLIMLSTCLRGQTGPQRELGGLGFHGSALSGIHAITGWADRVPCGPWGAFTDFISPRIGVAILAAAILKRRESGLGQHIDLSQIEAAIHFIEPLVLDAGVNGTVARPRGHESDRACPHGVYRVAGTERYVALACETAAQWSALKSLAPLDEFASSEFDQLGSRLEVDSAIDAALSAWLADKDPFTIVQTLKRGGVPAAVAAYPSDLYEDPQLAHRGFFVTCEHQVMGPTPYDGPATIFSETPAVLAPAPCLGQHTEMVVKELLGTTDDEFVKYLVAGALT